MATAPSVLRRGAVVRVSAGSVGPGVPLTVNAFLDVRFADGHVERWVGPGYIGEMPGGSDGMSRLQTWAKQASDEFAFDIACDVARAYSTDPPPIDHLHCEEVVIEWNSPGELGSEEHIEGRSD